MLLSYCTFFLKMHSYIYSTLYGIASLGKVLLGACGSIVHGEGVVAGIAQVASPQAHHHLTHVGIDMCACHGIELLRIGVGVVPVGLALCVDVGTEGDASQPRLFHVAARVCCGT